MLEAFQGREEGECPHFVAHFWDCLLPGLLQSHFFPPFLPILSAFWEDCHQFSGPRCLLLLPLGRPHWILLNYPLEGLVLRMLTKSQNWLFTPVQQEPWVFWKILLQHKILLYISFRKNWSSWPILTNLHKLGPAYLHPKHYSNNKFLCAYQIQVWELLSPFSYAGCQMLTSW